MKNKITFLISLLSPLLPVLAMLIFNKIGQALPLLILSGIILVAILYSIVALIRLKEKSTGMKVAGTLMGVLGILVTLIIGFISGAAMTKI